MDLLKTISRRSFLVSFFFMLLLFGLLNIFFWIGQDIFQQWLKPLATLDPQPRELETFLGNVARTSHSLNMYFIPVSAGLMLFFTLLQWLFLRVSISRAVKKTHAVPVGRGKKHPHIESGEKTDKSETLEHDRRMYLYLLSVLQREGRFLDFIAEDLDLYEDEQIGAAVRNIHRNCKKVIENDIAPEPVLDKPEGEQVIVEPGFDTMTIKLTGNVIGEPPFKGILRHKGWRAKKAQPPTLTEGQDARILDSAEVEIL